MGKPYREYNNSSCQNHLLGPLKGHQRVSGQGRGSGPCLWHQVLVKQCQSELSVLGALKAVIGHISIVLCVLEYSEEWKIPRN